VAGTPPALAARRLQVYTRIMLDVACFCTRARRAARALTQHYDAALAPVGLKVTQFSLLRAIGRLDVPSISALARATGLDRSTLGRNLRVLQKMGLVALGPGDDERTRMVSVTGTGKAVVADAMPLWAEAQARVTACLEPAEHDRLWHALARLQSLASLEGLDARR
jgi:DNA-binding MarR family transcriptional regulator